MAWRKENGADGLPIWRGKDSIYDMADMSRMPAGCLGLAIAIGSFCAIPTLGGWALLGIIGAVPIALMVAPKAGAAANFIGDEWQLVASPAGLQLKLPVGREGQILAKFRNRWSAPLDTIARVETARTKEYEVTRRYENALIEMDKVQAIPDNEWQVFLFMADGTRRVIYHANAARDDCAALAASIRSWLETARAAGPATQPAAGAAPSQSSPARPVADGFDL